MTFVPYRPCTRPVRYGPFRRLLARLLGEPLAVRCGSCEACELTRAAWAWVARDTEDP